MSACKLGSLKQGNNQAALQYSGCVKWGERTAVRVGQATLGTEEAVFLLGGLHLS